MASNEFLAGTAIVLGLLGTTGAYTGASNNNDKAVILASEGKMVDAQKNRDAADTDILWMVGGIAVTVVAGAAIVTD